MYKIVFFDIDGTLLDTNREVPQSTLKAINRLKQNGVIVVIASARSPFNIDFILAETGIDSYIGLNGSLIVYKGSVLHSESIAHGIVERFINMLQTKKHSAIVHGQSTFSIVADDSKRIYRNYLSNHWKMGSCVDYKDFIEPVSQIELFCHDDEESQYTKAFPELTFYPWISRPNAFNVLKRGVSKARGIEKILELLHIEREEAVAFGDGPNDIEMLRFVGMGVAMGNAVPELKRVANYTTSHVDEDGIENGLKALKLM